MLLEYDAGELPYWLLVLHQQNGPPASRQAVGLLAFRRGIHLSTGQREKNSELCAAPDGGLNFNPAGVLLNDAVHGCETEASSFAEFLGSEKWFEQMPDHLRRHAATG